jgi:Subtilase family
MKNFYIFSASLLLVILFSFHKSSQAQGAFFSINSDSIRIDESSKNPILLKYKSSIPATTATISGAYSKVLFTLKPSSTTPNTLEIPKKFSYGAKELPILGGKYKIVFAGDTEPIDLQFFGKDTGPKSAQGIETDEFNILVCPKGKVLNIETIRKVLKDEGINDNSLQFIQSKSLEGEVAPCDCTFYTLKTGNKEADKFPQYIKALSNLRSTEFPYVLVSPNIVRFLAPHAVYGLGPDTADYDSKDYVIADSLPSTKIYDKKLNLVVIDSGVVNSSNFKSKMIKINAVDNLNKIGGHGTPIAYIASDNNPYLNLYSEQVCDSEGHCPESNVIPAICRYAKGSFSEKTVINMSMFSASPSKILDAVMKSMSKKQIYFTAAAGNADNSSANPLGMQIKKALANKQPLFGLEGMYPAGVQEKNIFGIESLDSKGAIVDTSLPGPHIKAAACGRWLSSVDPIGATHNGVNKDATGKILKPYSGTSFATAVASGKLLSFLSQGKYPIKNADLSVTCP